MVPWTEETITVAGTQLVVVKGGTGEPVLVLHDELGYPGWMQWNARLATGRQLWLPLQPGFGKTPPLAWLRHYRDLAGFYEIGRASCRERVYVLV